MLWLRLSLISVAWERAQTQALMGLLRLGHVPTHSIFELSFATVPFIVSPYLEESLNRVGPKDVYPKF